MPTWKQIMRWLQRSDASLTGKGAQLLSSALGGRIRNPQSVRGLKVLDDTDGGSNVTPLRA